MRSRHRYVGNASSVSRDGVRAMKKLVSTTDEAPLRKYRANKIPMAIVSSREIVAMLSHPLISGALVACFIVLPWVTEATAADRAASTRTTSHAHCPANAIKSGRSPFPVTIDWIEITTDQEAINCLHRLATVMGPKMTAQWAEQNGFKADFIKQPWIYEKDILLSVGWSIKRHGPLYNSGMKSIIVWLFAYGQVFSFRWQYQGPLVVGQSYTFE